ncbi:MbtH family NRPS accessory protein [Streptomyces filamentosus]|uniref:MbtH family NRPS accessory protein n=2 Tax=Streptomyces filamentosus TaxID=67294 RepID=A0ABY4UWQ2_STRFL|nr:MULTISPECIES: MbtH family NRPS accessory protein [Streptomyces]ESU49207.1 MbtH domain-containing protein [Streptomyces sp. HCCB10043]EWS92642.1 MbtH domain-containing protein [Streptomyces filamentosus NRRL 11379]MYR79666.1 MbtH family NRPS accessory protein [Streptomyces sp. SID5466]USC48781.1 MbtH family NRPS accessory protein [Streptomyces filamentosus]
MSDDEAGEFRIVRNGEEQYSVWPAGQDLPAGWFEVGQRGTRADCLARVGRSWTDMRPASLRRGLSGDEDGASRG